MAHKYLPDFCSVSMCVPCRSLMRGSALDAATQDAQAAVRNSPIGTARTSVSLSTLTFHVIQPSLHNALPPDVTSKCQKLLFYIPEVLGSNIGHPASTNCATAWSSWLRHCATNRKVAVSIPDGVIGNFH
jgi:hypothetical protein